jgi:hypothetical protein
MINEMDSVFIPFQNRRPVFRDVKAQWCPNLDAHGVGTGADEGFDLEMLLLDVPPFVFYALEAGVRRESVEPGQSSRRSRRK